MKKKHLYATVILLLLLAVGIQPAFAFVHTLLPPAQIPEFGEWVSGTQTFTLTSNVPDGDSILISKSGLTLDGDEAVKFSITGPGSSGVGVDIIGGINAINGITVKNLTINGFSIGIRIDNSNLIPAQPDKNTVENNTLSNCTTGILLFHTNRTILKGNTISNSTWWGIRLESAGNEDEDDIYDFSNTIEDNTLNLISDTGGIWLKGSSFNTLSGNSITGNNFSFAGIYLSLQSNDNVLTSNDASDSEYGIKLLNSSDNILTGNTTSNNDYGIWLDPSINNQINNNNFINNATQASVADDSIVNDFNGNYWSDLEEGSDTYVIYSTPSGIEITDNSPWTEQDGWLLPDTTPPEITCPGDTSIEAMEPDGVPIDDDRIQTFLAGVSATDNIDPPEAITITND